MRVLFAPVALVAVLLACRASDRPPPAVPTAPTPEPTPVSVHAIPGVVFYDENASGSPDPGEDVRLPGVTVTAATRSATSDAFGAFTLAQVPAGPRSAGVEAATLPPFFRAGPQPSFPVPPPAGFALPVPLGLPIGTNRPNVYMAFGDSVTSGDGSRGGRGYRAELQSRLRGHWGRGEVADEGVPSTRSDEGAARIGASLAAVRPAWTLILYGTNDWNLSACRRVCFTIENVRSMIRQTRAAGSLPVMGTVIPANPAYVDRLAEQRNLWIDQTNAELVPMARQEGAVVADLNAAMRRETADLRTLFTDHVHPNDRGYAAVAAEFFRAITQPAAVPGRPVR